MYIFGYPNGLLFRQHIERIFTMAKGYWPIPYFIDIQYLTFFFFFCGPHVVGNKGEAEEEA